MRGLFFLACWQRHCCVAEVEGRVLGEKDADPTSREFKTSENWLEEMKFLPCLQDFSD